MKSNKPAVVLDTNVLLVALPTRSPYRPIFDKLVAEAYDLVISNDIVTEYEEEIAKRYDAQTVEGLFLVLLMLPNVQRVTPYFRWRLIINDPDDDKFVDAAVVANVDYLVTNDRHFNGLKKIEFPKVNLCTAEEFLAIIKNL
jgi:putative PIN family toxin of toxin-antitoxin system